MNLWLKYFLYIFKTNSHTSNEIGQEEMTKISRGNIFFSPIWLWGFIIYRSLGSQNVLVSPVLISPLSLREIQFGLQEEQMEHVEAMSTICSRRDEVQ